jgi:hypothetical protein
MHSVTLHDVTTPKILLFLSHRRENVRSKIAHVLEESDLYFRQVG